MLRYPGGGTGPPLRTRETVPGAGGLLPHYIPVISHLLPAAAVINPTAHAYSCPPGPPQRGGGDAKPEITRK